MAACYPQGAVSKLAIDGQQFPFVAIQDASVRNLVDDNDDIITGFMDPLEERVSLGTLDLIVNVRLRPSYEDLTTLLPNLGMSDSGGGVYTLDESLASFDMIIDRVTKVHTYATCYVNQWTLGGSRGTKPIYLDLQIFGSTWSEGNAGSFSATALNDDPPIPFTNGAITLKSSSRLFDRFALSVNHHCERYFENALTPGCIDMTHRTTTLATSVPYTSTNQALFGTSFAAVDGAAATLAFTRTNQAATLAFQNAIPISRPPSIPGKTGIRWDAFYRLYRDISNKTYTWTHDDTAGA